jgi:hypothetical protein
MKLTIIPEDKTVYIDNWSIGNLDLSFIPENVHALQWKNDLGWIEFVENDDFTKPQNEVINQLPDWANTAVARWTEAKESYEAQQRTQQRNVANNQPITTGSQTL